MTHPIINILIRSHGNRPYEKAVMSVFNENYPGARVWIHHDQHGPRDDYSYNLICNEMSNKIWVGWFFFLDSDDTLVPGSLWLLAKELEDKQPSLLICQFIRNGTLKPSRTQIKNREIKKGNIGLPCAVVDCVWSDRFFVQDNESGDFQAIDSLARTLLNNETSQKGLVFSPFALVNSPKRGHGK